MTTLREAAQQALEALSCIEYEICGITDGPSKDSTEAVIDALRAALAEPVQEPVAWLYEVGTDRTLHWLKPPLYGTPLYTTPPHRKPLTDEELCKVFPAIATYTEANKTLYRSIARAIERAHGIGGDA